MLYQETRHKDLEILLGVQYQNGKRKIKRDFIRLLLTKELESDLDVFFRDGESKNLLDLIKFLRK